MDSIRFLWVGSVLMSAAVSSDAVLQNFTGVPCRYDMVSSGLKVDCSRRSLPAIPISNLTEETIILDMSSNRLSKLANNSLCGLPNIMSLNFQSNNLSNMIERGAFRLLPNLNSTALANNNITSLPAGLFSKNGKLQAVNLANNRLDSFSVNVFNSVSTLRVVDVTHNFITRLHFEGFKSRNLSRLLFTSNRLSMLYEDDFLPLKDARIDKLDLSNNNLTSLKSGLFQHLNLVRGLGLSRNYFRNFSVLPFIGMSSLQKLSLANNKISVIQPIPSSLNPTHVFPPVTYLDLQGNNIRTMPSRAFWGLSKLIRLDIHQSRIKTIQNDSFEGLDSLEILDLTGNPISHVTSDMFIPFCPRLRSLILPQSKLSQLNQTRLGGITTLTSLNLARGVIRFIVIRRVGWNMPALQSLDISFNRLSRIDKNSFYGMTNLTFLNISNNPIKTIENAAFATNDQLRELRLDFLESFGSVWTPFTNLYKLTSLQLSHTPVKQITYKLFTGLTSLQRLHMNYCELSAVSFWDPHLNVPVLSNLSKLEYIFLKGNKLTNLLPGTFHGLQSLKSLNMPSCSMGNLHEDIFRNLTTLITLVIDQNPIKELTSQHFRDLTSLIGVSVKSNEIKELAVDLFSASPKLSYLYISHNHLTTIKEGTILPKRTLDLSYNPFGCNCDMTWFIDWVNKETLSISHPDKTNCSQASLSKFKNQPILNIDPRGVCGPRIIVYVISTFVIVTCIVVIIVAYKRRWLINYKCFHFKLLFVGQHGDQDGRERLDYEYDINLAFDEDDEQWVRGILKPGLEERLPDFDRIVCGDDDLPLGMYYIDAISEVVEQSYKSILIVSNRAVDNHEFISKLRLAVDQMNEVELEKVILIFKEDIPDGRLPYLVRLFLSKNKPYFRWSEDEYGQKLMWEKLVKELAWNKKMNDVLPI